MLAKLLTMALLAASAPAWAATEEKVINTVGGWLNYGLVEIGGVKLSALDFGSALLILFGAWLVSLFVRRGLERFSRSRPMDTHAAFYAIGRLLHYALLVPGC